MTSCLDPTCLLLKWCESLPSLLWYIKRPRVILRISGSEAVFLRMRNEYQKADDDMYANVNPRLEHLSRMKMHLP